MKRSTIVSVLACLLLSWQAAAAAPLWPQDGSEFQPDPALRYGALPNGMRYILQRNATPAGQVSLRLRFDAGSINEAEDQRGLAHFLEHMAFRGSINVPDGEVERTLQRLGLRMGADTNASTSYTQTVYQFDLAQNDAESLRTGLALLREICDRLLLDGATFNTERGVVLAEAHLRDNATLRATESLQAFLLQGQLVGARLPIGVPAILETAPVERVRRFYRAWYRPERATLIVVGDADPDALAARIAGVFGDWHNDTPAPAEPARGQPLERAGSAHLFSEAGAQPALTLAWARPWSPPPRSRDGMLRELQRQLGEAILSRRLQTAAAAADRRFVQGGAGSVRLARSAEFELVSAGYEPGKWRAALEAAELQRRQLAEQGAQAAELDRELLALRTALQARAAAAATRRSPQLADELVANLDTDDISTSAAQDLQLFDELRPRLTLAAINDALRDTWRGSGPLVFVSSPEPIDGGEIGLLGALRAADAAPLGGSAAAHQLNWPYTAFGRPGRVVRRRELADLGIVTLRYANGVKLNVKRTPFGADQVLVNVYVGDGLLGLPRDRPALAWAAGAVTRGGLGQLSYDELQQVLTGRVWRAAFAVADNSYTFMGQTRPADLLVQLQVLAAYVTDAGFRPEGIQQFRDVFLPQLATLRTNPSAVLGTQLAGIVHDGDARWAFPTAAQVQALSAGQLRAWLQPALARGDIEIAIVGDVTPEAAAEAVARTFGALPGGRAAPRRAHAGDAHFPPAAAAPLRLAHGGASNQGIAAVAWPGTDALSNFRQSAERQLMLSILQDRLKEQMRERDGLSYSASAQGQASTVFPGFGFLLAIADLPPGRAPLLFDTVASLAAQLRMQPPTADELERARQPAIAGLEQARQSNQYWIGTLGQVQREPRLADGVRQLPANLRSVTAAEVQAAAVQYLDMDRAVRIVVQPELAAP